MPYPSPTLYPDLDVYPEEGFVLPELVVGAEDPGLAAVNLKLAMSIKTADGIVHRWGGDEPDARRVPRGLQLSTSDPGGDKDCSWAAARRADTDMIDLSPLDELRVYGEGQRAAWTGYVTDTPIDHGADFSVSPIAIGWQGYLLDDPSFVEIYVDRDPERWQPPTVTRRIGVGMGGHVPPYYAGAPSEQDFQVTSDVGVPLQFTGPGDKSVYAFSNAERWYHAPPECLVAKVVYQGTDIALDPDMEAPTWFGNADPNGGPGGVASAMIMDGALRTLSIAAANRRRFNCLRAYAEAPFTVTGVPFSRTIQKLAIYGAHTVPLHTAQVAGEPDGVYASEVIADVVRRAAPKLALVANSIDPTAFPIPHLSFLDPVSAADVIAEANVYHQRFWGVYDGPDGQPTFYYRAQDNPRRKWRCRLDEGAELGEEGKQAETIYVGAIVRFTDPDGVSRVIGPPLPGGFDYTDARLLDTDPTNLANRHDRKRKLALVELDVITDQNGAATLGELFLSESKALTHRGSITLHGRARDDRRNWWPVWEVKAGDTILVEDAHDTAVRRIIETSYSHDERSVTLTLDNTPHRFDALMERMGASLTGLNIGGGG